VFKKVLVVGVLALAILAVGCGGDSDETETEATAITKAAFIRKADRICRLSREKFVEVGFAKAKKLADKPKAREALEFELIETLFVPTLENEIEELRALGAPPGDEAKIEKILELTEDTLEEAKTEPETFVAGEDYKEGFEHYGDAYKLARKSGMTECPLR
jgi:hypothetical protein